MRQDRIHGPFLTILAMLLPGAFSAGAVAQESASFVMERVTLSATASQAASTSFDMAVSFGQEVPVGSASLCNVGYLQTFGFWSVLGFQDAPTRLSVAHGLEGPEGVELTWTGSSDSFTLFRSDQPQDLAQPGNVALVTAACNASDGPPPGIELVFYVVLLSGGP